MYIVLLIKDLKLEQVMKKEVLMSFYVKDRHNRHVKLADVRSAVGYVANEAYRTQVGNDLGLGGWNYVVCGSVKMYKDEGPGMKSNMIESVYVDGVAGHLVVEVIAEVEQGVQDGVLVLPRRRGLVTVWRVSGQEWEEEEVSEVESLVARVLTVEALSKYTKAELLVLCDEWGLDVKSSWKKAEVIDYMIKNG